MCRLLFVVCCFCLSFVICRCSLCDVCCSIVFVDVFVCRFVACVALGVLRYLLFVVRCELFVACDLLFVV